MQRTQKKLERKQRKAKIRAQQYAAAAERKNQKGQKQNVKRPVKINGYSFNKKAARLSQKRTEAKIRQNNWAKLSVVEQIAELKERPGQSKKQLSRLEKLV